MKFNNLKIGNKNRFFTILTLLYLTSTIVHAQQLTFDQVWIDSLIGRQYNVRSITFGQNEVLFAGTMGRGLWKSTNYGNTWASIDASNGFIGSQVWDITTNHNSGLILAASYPGGLYRSNDNGITGMMLTNKLGLVDSIIWGTSILITLSGDIFFGSAGYGIFKSTDNGDSWQTKSTGIPFLDSTHYYITRSLVVNIYGELFVIVGSDEGYDHNRGIYKSVDNGNHWFREYTGMDYGIPLKRIIISPINNYLIVVSGFFPPYGGIFLSINRGENWVRVFNGASSWWGLSVNRDGMFFAGARNDGIYRSNIYGVNWILVSNPAIDVQAITFDLNGRMFLGTSNGVFRSRESTTDINENNIISKLTITLAQNYPNPLNPTTIIDYSLPQPSHVTLKVFNTLGEQVAILVDEAQNPGHKSVQFDASSLPSGVYLYRLIVGSFVETRKLVLLR